MSPTSSERRAPAPELGPYARLILDRARAKARFLHADELALEHVLATLMEDEDAGATRMVLHAFADPATLAIELLALSPGILVVGSGRSLPFSMRGVRALEAARRRGAAAEGGVAVEALWHGALEEIDPAARGTLGLPDPAGNGPDAPPDELRPQGSFFASFSQPARRALAYACRLAGRRERDQIAPAHLAVAALEADEALRRSTGVVPGGLAARLADLDLDPTPRPQRELGTEDGLAGLLEALPPGADTQLLFARVLTHGREELRLLFAQQKITTALAERTAGRFPDPEVDS